MTTPISEIGRTFFDLPSDKTTDMETSELLASFSSRSIDWTTLLQSDRVLIVSEAGMGKSFECRQQQERLWNGGEAAFFVELSDLASGPFEDRLSPQELARFESWELAQTERAVFFLDSVDELALTRTSFASALKLFARSLGDNLGRACIVLTTRPIAVDRDIIRRHLPIPERAELVVREDEFAEIAMRTSRATKDSPSHNWRFVALAPLSEVQMRTLASQRSVADIDGLLAAINARNAYDFAKRPLDFLELCSDWRDHGHIRPHRAQLDHSVEVKLRPRKNRAERAPLDYDKAREGAARLALAALLTRKLTFWHGSDDDRRSGDGTLDPAQILTGWSDDEIRTLLERPLFGFAAYGRVRFHHRSAIEFLAAERLSQLRDQGLPDRTLMGLLFALGRQGERVVKPAMRAVAAWLAQDVAPVRDEVLKHEPGMLLHDGDPESLNLSIRRRALSQYVAAYGKGGWRGQPVPSLQVQRFASKDLADLISQAWSTGVENPEVRETLLALIGAAQIDSLADLVYRVAVDPGSAEDDRLYSLIALGQLNDARLAQLLDEISAVTSGWPVAIAERAVIQLFPSHMSVDQLLGSLARLRPAKRSYGGAASHLPLIIARGNLPDSQVLAIRKGLQKLVVTDLKWNEQIYRVISGRKDLVPSLLSACLREFASGSPGTDVHEAIAIAGLLAKSDHRADDDVSQLRAALDAAPEATREKLFWEIDRLACEHHPKDERSPISRTISFHDQAIYRLGATKDTEWVLRAIANAHLSLDQRQLAMEVAIDFARGDVDLSSWVAKLDMAAGSEPTLRERANAFRDLVDAPPSPPAWVRESEKRREKERRKHATALESWRRFYRDLKQDPDAAFSSTNVASTAWNFWRAMEREHDDLARPGWNRGFIERMFDKTMADRFRDAFARSWREDRPTIRSEREEDQKNTYLMRWRMGLAGVYAEAEDRAWAAKLTVDEADLASRYALLDLNQLPPWIEDLIECHPSAVDAIIASELSSELEATDTSHSMLLQYIRSAPATIAQFFVPRIRSWLVASLADGAKKPHPDKLKRAAEHLLEYGTADDEKILRGTALSKLDGEASSEEHSLWLPILGRLDLAAMVDVLERLAAATKPAKSSEVVRLLGELFGHRASLGLAALVDQPELLLRLLRVANKHVRPEHDEIHEGTYSPSGRDDAEYARSALFNTLLDAKGEDAWRHKLSLAEDPDAARYRERVIALARENLAAELDTFVLTEKEVIQFERDFEFAPKTRREMATLLRARLDDIDDLLLQDGSPRELWATIEHERLLRRDLARELGRLGREGYVSVQEAVTADEKETDIRLMSKAAPLEAAIELKVGENGYTMDDFRHALKVQLVEKYMAPEQRRVGALVISWAGKKAWNDPDTGEEIRFEEVIRRLDAEAQLLAPSLGHDAFLTVRGLYLGPRTFDPKASAKKRGKKNPTSK